MSDMAGYCRACLGPAGDAGTCRNCGHHRLIRHPEINQLSIAHIDCDAFYAAIEKRDDPSLEDKPVIIGGGKRGVVSTACYVARLYGVKSAMPMFKALKACPDAVVISPRMSVYAEEGGRIREIMREVTPVVEPLSIDEAFLDLTGTERLHHAPPALTLLKLQRRIRDIVGITVSVGLSYNKFLAKTASDQDKPDGFFILGRTDAPAFLERQPTRAVFGVGPVFAARLEKDGIKTLSDVIKVGEKAMADRYGDGGYRLARLAKGEDFRSVTPDRQRKSVSSETTFFEDIAGYEELEKRLWKQCVRVADMAKKKDISGYVVTLKLRTQAFRIITRRRTLSEPTQLADTLFRVGRELLKTEADGRKFRLIGIGISNLVNGSSDPRDLLDPDAPKRAAAERAMDKARAKFGSEAVIKGRSLKSRQ
ncbi:DNA polymerase IV [Hyphobacterium sp. HN65]|uniref:DNA polymerase IV n=1 Tax=Hyphobacterium lacteum TaxID=3116575 RepID=A0ABU7LMI6_9PROT|nr:DNA polymerase IV [Hyphobacterium sp. HN65]MEE2525135.1 DNA polymerase IV [Hyphobacterium sp. HN65]